MDWLFVPLLALHLLCMNVASAGPLVACWLEWKARCGDAIAQRAANYLSVASWWALVVGAMLGLVMGWLLWNDAYERLWLTTLRYKATMGLYEFVFSLCLLGVTAWLGTKRPAGNKSSNKSESADHTSSSDSMPLRGLRMLFALLAGTNLLYHFPFLFAVAVELHTLHPDASPLDVSAFRSFMLQPSILSRVVHVVLASFAVSGMMLFGLALRIRREGESPQEIRRVVQWGAWWALLPSLLQILVGLWVVAALPGAWQQRVMGEDMLATSLLGISILLSVFMLQDFAALAFGDEQPKIMIRSMAYMLLIVLCMTGVLRGMRPTTQPQSWVPSPIEPHQSYAHR